MKKLILLILGLSGTTSFSQTNLIQNAVHNTAVQSPNAAALFRYSETPVSQYTGVPDINIPIYTIKEGDIELPISISYHAGGIKVNDEASSVGLGWSLNAGGRVSHIMAGSNDFSYDGYYNIYPKSAGGYIGSVSDCPTPTWNNSTAVRAFYTNNFRIVNVPGHSTLYPEYDFQPDLFLINLPTKSHKAYLDMSKTTKTDYPKFAIVGQPNIDFKLIPESGSFIPSSHGDYKFKVIDETGLNYYFEGAQETSTPLTGTYITGVSEYLSKIEDVKGRKINFYYTNPLHADRIAGCSTTRYNFSYLPGDTQNPHFTSASTGLTKCNKQTVKETFIEKIEFSNGRIEFVWSDREDINKSKKLSSIKIYNNYKLIKQYDFNYDYFVAGDNLGTNSLVSWLGASDNKIFTHRLKLRSMTESVTNEKYLFDYNSTYNLPNKLSFSSDFWGFYNGQTNSDSFIPDPNKYVKGQNPFTVTSFNQDQSGYWYDAYASGSDWVLNPEIRHINFTTDNKHYLSDRRASLFSLAGLLTSITYPTGGKTEFEYELNTFSNYPIQSLLDNVNIGVEKNYSSGGGVRIKNIKTIENPGSIPLIKNYIYDELTDNGTKIISNGNLSEFPKFYEIENRCFIVKGGYTNQILSEGGGCSTVFYPNSGFQDHPFRVSVYEGGQSQGTSTLPQGGLVGYSKVTEKVTGKGKKESFFTNNYSSSCLSMIPRGNAIVIGNGDLTKQMTYDSNNNLINEISYLYKFNYPDNLNTYFISGAILEPVTKFTTQFSGAQDNYPPFGGLIHSYSINLYKSLLESTITKEYFPLGSSNFVETKKQITYNNKYLPSIEKTTFPDNVINETKYNYALEKNNQLLINKNIVGIPLETIITESNNGITKTLSKIETLYPTSLPDAQIGNLVLPKSVTTYDHLNNSSVTEVTLDKYDPTGNLIQYTTKDGKPVSIIWGYNSSLPIAKIEGAQYNDITTYVQNIITSSNTDAVNPFRESELLNAEDNLRKNANLVGYQITTYTHDPLIGTTSVTPPSGITEYYKYDTTNRLEKIVDVNNKILKEYKSRYGNNPFASYSNAEKSQVFTRTNCTGNTVGGSYTYIVPAGTYVSDTSQLAADQKALDDITLNGQNVTNQNGPCMPIISCGFTFSITPQYGYGTITTVDNKVNFSVTFSSYGMWQGFTSSVNIGKVGASCAPSVNREITYNEGGRQWKVFIATSGDCSIRLVSGTVDPSLGSPLNFNFQYQK